MGLRILDVLSEEELNTRLINDLWDVSKECYYIFICYIPLLSLNKTSTVIGGFLVTCP